MTASYLDYVEGSVLAADPLELVSTIYRIALSSIDEAIMHLQSGDAMARSKAVTKAHAAVTELVNSLDHDKGGQISRELASLYEYALAELINGHAKKSEESFRAVRRVLATLSEAWSALKAPASEPVESAQYEAPAAVSASPYGSFGWQEQTQSRPAQSWTL